MALDPLATAADLAVRLRTTFVSGSVDELAATAFLTDASALVRAATGQRISPVETDTVSLSGGDLVLNLPQRPVIVGQGHPLTVTEFDGYGSAYVTLVEDRDYIRHGHQLIRASWPDGFISPDGAQHRGTGGVWAEKVQVTYSHGLATVPAEIKAVVVGMAMRAFLNPAALRSRTIGDYSETFATETVGSTDLTDGDMRKLARAGWAVNAHVVRLR